MPELAIFIVGAIAVAAAILMLISTNAVHSALSLIVTMICIAFLFLTLNAPFLAMIQITVYAGAIMVLFLFVIMLLGAERLDAETVEAPVERRFRWYLPLAIVLALVMMVGIALATASPSTLDTPAPPPQIRVLNAAPDAGSVDVYAGEELIASGVGFRDASPFVEVPPGDVPLSVHFPDGRVQDFPVTLEGDTYQTLIAYGEGAEPQLTVVADDLTTVTRDRSSRVAVFNAYAEPVSLVDFRSEFDANDTVVLIPELAPGQISETFYVEEGSFDWSFAPVGAQTESERWFRMNEYEFDVDDSELLVFVGAPTFDGANTSLNPVVLPYRHEARPAFGGPRAIGYMLFTDYLLPFQLLGLLLLAAMVGAIVLTHREVERAKGRVGGRRRVSRPLVNVIAAQVGHDVVTTAETPAQLPDTSGD